MGSIVEGKSLLGCWKPPFCDACRNVIFGLLGIMCSKEYIVHAAGSPFGDLFVVGCHGIVSPKVIF